MSTNVLATEVVELKADGESDVTRAINAIHGRLLTMNRTATAAKAPLRGLASMISGAFALPQRVLEATGNKLTTFYFKMQGVRQFLQKFAFGAGLTAAGLFHGAMKDTIEADQLSRALSRLARVLGDELAPYVRSLTVGIRQLTLWYRSLDLETRRSITRWALLSAAIGGVAMIAPMVLRALAGVALALSYLANPLILIPTLIFAVVAGLAYMNASGDSFAEKMQSMAETVIQAWFGIRGVVRVVTEEIGAMVRLAADVVGHQAAGLKEMLKGNFAAAKQHAVDAAAAAAGMLARINNQNANQRGDRIFEEEGKNAQRWIDRMKVGAKQAAALIAPLMGLGQGAGFHIKADIGFESGQQTWERMMTAFGQQGAATIAEQQLKEQKDANKMLGMIHKDLGGLEPAVA